MPYLSPRTWKPTELPTHTQLNQELITNPRAIQNMMDHSVKVYRNATQSIANDSRALVQWTSQQWEIGGGMFDIGNPTRLTVPTGAGGLYLVNSMLGWTPNSTGRRGVGYRIENPSDSLDYDMQFNDSNGGAVKQNGVDMIKLRGDQYVTIYGYQSSGAALTMLGSNLGSSSACLTLMGVPNAGYTYQVPDPLPADGDIVSSHWLNTYVRDNLQALRCFGGHFAKVYLDDNLSVQPKEQNPITWAKEVFHGGDVWDGSSFVAPIDGFYMLIPTVEFRHENEASVGAIRGVGFTISTSNLDYNLQFQSGEEAGVSCNGMAIVPLKKGNKLDVWAYHDAEQPLLIRGGSRDQTRCFIGWYGQY